MDATQILLIVVVSVLTVLLTVIGIQVIYILGEIRKSLQKMNKMLDDATSISHDISKSMNSVGGLFEGLKTGLSVVNFFGKKKEHHT